MTEDGRGQGVAEMLRPGFGVPARVVKVNEVPVAGSLCAYRRVESSSEKGWRTHIGLECSVEAEPETGGCELRLVALSGREE